MSVVCGGSGVDADQDGICDDVDECVGEYDDCGLCNGPGTQQCGMELIYVDLQIVLNTLMCR